MICKSTEQKNLGYNSSIFAIGVTKSVEDAVCLSITESKIWRVPTDRLKQVSDKSITD